jgi:hypothetical protein
MDDRRRPMGRVALTKDWSIDLDAGFQRRAEGGDLVFWAAGRTVYASVYEAGSTDAEAAIARMLEERPGLPKQVFDRSEPGLVGHAYLMPEGEDDNAYWGLNTWTSSADSVACVTFYFDVLTDLAWAMAAWESVSCGRTSERRYLN